MSKSNLIFKIISAILLIVNIVFAVYLVSVFVMVLNQILILTNIHFILIIAAIVINVVYSIYVAIFVLKDKKTRKLKVVNNQVIK